MKSASGKPKIISIVSKKRSGKTTLIERLVPLLKSRGYRVGTVKHDTHGFDIDHEGKDTWRHKRSGAERVLISSPWKISLIEDVPEEMPLDEIVTKFFAEMDIVLTEGYRSAGKPQIEVFLSSAHKAPLHEKSEAGTLIAVVSDIPIDIGAPRFEMNDVTGLATFIENTFLKPSIPQGGPFHISLPPPSQGNGSPDDSDWA